MSLEILSIYSRRNREGNREAWDVLTSKPSLFYPQLTVILLTNGIREDGRRGVGKIRIEMELRASRQAGAPKLVWEGSGLRQCGELATFSEAPSLALES